MPDSGAERRSAALRRFNAPRQIGPDLMPVRHPFTPDRCAAFDPFLYLAHFGPRELQQTRWGFGPHPHRGFEAITYLLAGEIEHRDSFGAHAILGPGDVQWMTAGAGIVHSEEPPDSFRRSGGLVHGFQIWLDLPADLKMSAPGFQMLRTAEFPAFEPASGVKVRLIAGSCTGWNGPAAMHSAVFVWHLTLAPGASWNAAKPAGWSAFSYAFSPGSAGDTAVFDRRTIEVALENSGRKPLELLLLGGQPLSQPVASYGPFVMNTRAEVLQAIHDYQDGRMGALPE